MSEDTTPALTRLTARTDARRGIVRGPVGLARSAEEFEARERGGQVLASARRREENFTGFADEIRTVDDHFRRIRYRSGPWDGESKDLLPVSWFLLWRSNVTDHPRPALLRKEPVARGFRDVREGLPERGGPERPDPRTFTTRAPARTTARDSQSLRSRPTTEE